MEREQWVSVQASRGGKKEVSRVLSLESEQKPKAAPEDPKIRPVFFFLIPTGSS